MRASRVAATLAGVFVLAVPTMGVPQELDLVDLIDTYAAAWNEVDPERRAELLRRCWAPEGVYTDPTALVVGLDALHAHITGFQSDMRGARIERSSGVDMHHGWLRFTWRIVAADGTELGRGFDVGEVGEDGRLLRIIGFFGDFPEE